MQKTIPSDEQIRSLFVSQRARHENVMAAIAGENRGGYLCCGANIMEHAQLNRLAARNGMKDPDYKSNYKEVYIRASRELGTTHIDQFIPDNPLTMGDKGYEGTEAGATTGLETVIVDGMEIGEPEDVVEHMERILFPRLEREIEEFDFEKRVRQIGLREYEQQMDMGLDVLKTGYDYIWFPTLGYYQYGYVNYFCAYALYEEVMEKHFKLQAELCRRNNEAAAEAIRRYALPELFRLDHDMTDSRSTLVDIRSLEKIWYPMLDYSLEPVSKNPNMRLIWHCDGNIMPMVPGLLEVGVRGFQGFQYEDGVDFAKLCKLRGRDGRPLFMEAGVSVTRTLPFGTPQDVKKEMEYLVEVHGDTALALGASSSVAPGVPSANIDAMIEGFHYYKEHLK